MVDARGVPLSIVVTGANRHDVTQLVGTFDASLGLPLRHGAYTTAHVPSAAKKLRLPNEVIARGRRPAGQSLKTNDEIARSERAEQEMDWLVFNEHWLPFSAWQIRAHQISDHVVELRLGSGDALTSMQKRGEFSVMVAAVLVRSNPRIKLSTHHVCGLNARR